MRLFELVQQHKSLELLMESEDDLPPDAIRDTLEGLQGEIEQKITSMAYVILNMQADADAIKEAAKAMQARSERAQKRAESLKHFLLLQMQLLDIKRIDATTLVIRRQDNPESVVILDESKVPAEYMRQPPPPPKVPDKKALKAALEAGVTFDGIFKERGEHVRISL